MSIGNIQGAARRGSRRTVNHRTGGGREREAVPLGKDASSAREEGKQLTGKSRRSIPGKQKACDA